MSNNPYQAPATTTPTKAPSKQKRVPARRFARFAGAMVDGILLGLINTPILLFVILPLLNSSFQELSTLAYDPIYLVVGFVVGQLVFLAVQGYLLATKGQTVGKLLVKTRIVKTGTSDVPEFIPLYTKRYLIMGIIFSVPVIGGFIALANALMIFRDNRHCLHDDIAGTDVIEAN